MTVCLHRLDFDYAKSIGCTVKLLGVSKREGASGVAAYVSPTLVPLSDDIGRTGGAVNIIKVRDIASLVFLHNCKSTGWVRADAIEVPG
jgi:hypothetical protein